MNWLLQRIEDHNGLVILATNMKNNIDASFSRRFQSIITFSLPSIGLRRIIWMKAFATKDNISADIDIQVIAEKYELSGKEIHEALKICRDNINSGKKIGDKQLIKAIGVVYKTSGRIL